MIIAIFLSVADFHGITGQMAQVADGLGAGSNIADGISEVPKTKKMSAKKSFFRKHHSKFDKITPFFSAVSNVFTLLGIMGDSPEVQRIDNLLKVVNKGFMRLETKMNLIKNRLDSLEDVVKREHFWTRLDPDLKKLHEVTARVLLYYDAPNKEAKKHRLAYFDEDEYNDVYDAFIAIKGTFEGKVGRKSLCDTLIENTKTDLQRVLVLSYNLYTRLFQVFLILLLFSTLQK